MAVMGKAERKRSTIGLIISILAPTYGWQSIASGGRYTKINPEVSKGDLFVIINGKLPPYSFNEFGRLLRDLEKDGVVERAQPAESMNGIINGGVLYRLTTNERATSLSKWKPVAVIRPKKGVSAYSPRGSHECGVCGTVIPGKGRHGKSKPVRQHSKADCDLAMCKMIIVK
jgi:hypothetical protein